MGKSGAALGLTQRATLGCGDPARDWLTKPIITRWPPGTFLGS
jgi:hypothetical protein